MQDDDQDGEVRVYEGGAGAIKKLFKQWTGSPNFGKDTNLPLEDDDDAEAKQRRYQEQQRRAVGHLRELLKGNSSSVIQENTRINKSKGMNESDAAALAIREARKKKE